MFSGIVSAVGKIVAITQSGACQHLRIQTALSLDDLNIGDSIAVNGVCLTITKIETSIFDVSIVPETLRLTNLSLLAVNYLVNLEKSLKVSDRMGGHYVQGHVDGMADILDITAEGEALLLKIRYPTSLCPYIINKGYVTLDGMSITVIESTSAWFTVTFIPHTLNATIANQYHVGTRINIEVDIVGKYVEKILEGYKHALSH